MRGVHIPGVNSPYHAYLVIDRSRRLLRTVRGMCSCQGYKTFSCSTQLSMMFKLLINIKIAKINDILRFETSMPIHVIYPANKCILTFISRINFTLRRVEIEKKFYNLGVRVQPSWGGGGEGFA